MKQWCLTGMLVLAGAIPAGALTPDKAAELVQALLLDGRQIVVAVAGLSVYGDLPADEKQTLENRITVQLVNDSRVTVVTRDELEALMREHSFQISDLVDKDSRPEIGRLLGADALLTGNLFTRQDELDLHLIDVETAEIFSAAATNLPPRILQAVEVLFARPGMRPGMRVAMVGVRDESTNGATAQTIYLERKLVTSLVQCAQAQDQPARIVSRLLIDRIIREWEFQQSDLVDQNTMARMGKLLGADAIVTGSYNAARDELTLYLLEVASARYLSATSVDMRKKVLGIPVTPYTVGGFILACVIGLSSFQVLNRRRRQRLAVRKALQIIRKKLKAVHNRLEHTTKSADGQAGIVEELRDVRRRLADLDELGNSMLAVSGQNTQQKLQHLWQELGSFKDKLYTGMVHVPAGRFRMGADKGQMDAAPEHDVLLSSFYIDPYPVTNREYKKFVDATGHAVPEVRAEGAQLYSWRNGAYPSGADDLPVVLVDWSDAAAYARWAGKRLPTEAEWERAALGNNMECIFTWGNFFEASNCNSKESNNHKVVKVGTYPPNSIGLYDMLGNVWEWLQDWYDQDAYSRRNNVNPQGPPSGTLRCIRGGCWNSPTPKIKNRGCMEPSKKHHTVGFRCVKDDYEN